MKLNVIIPVKFANLSLVFFINKILKDSEAIHVLQTFSMCEESRKDNTSLHHYTRFPYWSQYMPFVELSTNSEKVNVSRH